jgi:membrane-associated phospholipid phosphatase
LLSKSYGIFFWKVVSLSGTFFSWFLVILFLKFLQLARIEILPDQELFYQSMRPVLFAWIVCQILKKLVKRPRPWQKFPDRVALVLSPKDDSMPSSHAGTSFAFAAALILVEHPLWWAALIWSSLVIVSRYLLRVHYPSDLFAGAAVGAIVSWIYVYITY